MSLTTLAERYRLDELIATGGMGSVYRALDEHLGRPVAIKVLKRVHADDPTFLERFRREARAAAGVSHPNVATVFDYGERSSQPFIVMELVEGETLAERIDREGRLPWREAFAIAEQVARALAAAHAHGVVHRDVKPANILVDTSGNVKVTDFGIARAARATTLTRPGMVLGSANYVAPEQAQGNPVRPGADLYSLGCVLFEAITGTTPYQGPNAIAIATQHVSGPVPDPRDSVPDLPPEASVLIMRSLQKEAEDRFHSAAAMADALAAARAERPPAGAGDATVAMAAAPPPGADTVVLGRHHDHDHTPPFGWPAAARRDGVESAFGGHPIQFRPPDSAVGRRRAWWLGGVALTLAALLALPLVVSKLRDAPPSRPAAGASPATTSGASGKAAAPSGTRVRVPSLDGERAGAAAVRLRSLGLRFEPRFVDAGKERRGRVVGQDPPAGAGVERGATVRLLIGGRGGGKGRDKGGD